MKSKFYWALLLIWVVLIFVSSMTVVTPKQLASGVQTATGTSAEGFLESWKAIWWLFVKGWHATEFALLYFLARSASVNAKYAVLLSLCYALFDECHQILVPNRGARISDVCIDFLGVMLAWYFLDRRSKLSKDYRREVAIVVASVLLLAVLSFFPFGSLESLIRR